MSSAGGGGGPEKPTASQRALELATEVYRKKFGDEAAEEFVAKFKASEEAKARTMERRAEAEAISRSRVARGEGGEQDADLVPRPSARAARPRQARPLGDVLAERRGRQAARKEDREQQRRARGLWTAFRRRHARHNVRESEQAERIAEQVLQQHGVRHHFRLLPKVAFFGAYMAGLDRNGVGALQALMSCNMPKRRMQQVLRAAYEPRGYTPRREVTVGKRSHQSRYEYDQRTLSGPLWEEPGRRAEEHPGAIRVIQVAVFMWLAKTRTHRAGYSYVVRGFGRGVFSAVCRCGKDALFGHEKGVPGAVKALQLAGFVEYGQPPASKVAEIDRGPSGHAYNVFWLRTDPETKALEDLHRRLSELTKLPALERMVAEPQLLADRLSLMEQLQQSSTDALSRAQAPPPRPAESEIPF